MENRSNNNVFLKKKISVFFKKVTLGKILKYISYLLILAVYVLLIGRIMLSHPSGDMKKYIITDADHHYESEQVLTQKLSKSIDDNGYFHISNLGYLKNTNELQITVRYNNSTLDKLEAMYGKVSDKGETFVFLLTDTDGKVYDKYQYLDKSNLIYNYRRLIFEDVDFENTDSLRLGIFYVNDVTKTSPIYTDFLIYDKDNTEYTSELKFGMNDHPKPGPAFIY